MKWFPLITSIHIGREPRERGWSREKQPKKDKKIKQNNNSKNYSNFEHYNAK